MTGPSMKQRTCDVRVIGWPRSGTTWLANMLSGCGCVMRQRHELPRLQDIDRHAHVFTTRDPRNAIVSHYFFHLYHHAARLGQTFESLTLLDYAKQYFAVGGDYIGRLSCGWREYHERWLDLVENYNIANTCYEKLLLGTESELSRILSVLDVPFKEHDLKSVVGKQHKRVPYVKIDGWSSAPRTIIVGNVNEWKDHLDNEVLEFLRHYCGDIALKLGYQLGA